MQCTPEQIEAKKRLAQQKLQLKRKLNSSTPSKDPSDTEAVSPSKQFCFKPFSPPKYTLPFYGATKTVSVNFYLISALRFAVSLSGYSQEIIDVFKTIASKSYNVNTKTWDFDLKDYDNLQAKLCLLKPNVETVGIPSYALKSCRRSKLDPHVDLNRIDSELLGTLMPFQTEGVRYGIDKNGRCLIADDMGLGKTLQALGIASYYKKDWPLLIVTTSSMKNIWEESIRKFLPSVSVLETQYMISSKDYINEAKVLIVSHDMMSRSIHRLIERRFGVIIIDESHVIKNFKTKCTKSAISLAKNAKRIILLSGTPALSRPSELYSQLSLVDDKFFGNFYNYSKRYCDGKNTSFGWDASGQSNLQELEVVLGNSFMIRRTKQDVLKMLPRKIQEIVNLDVDLSTLPEDDRRCLTALATTYSNTKRGTDKHFALISFFAETSKIKFPFVCSYLSELLKGEVKFLVFAHHKIMLDALESTLHAKKKKFIRIDGNTTSEQRKYFVDKFQLDDSYICALLSITAANAGITLTSAQLIIFAELHWNPSILSQAESRAHRIGQENEVIVRYLLAPGTADDAMWHLLLEKQKTLKQIGLSRDSFENLCVFKQQLSREEVSERFSSDGVKRTNCDTLDISSFFEAAEKEGDHVKDGVDVSDCFDDGMDEIFSRMDV